MGYIVGVMGADCLTFLACFYYCCCYLYAFLNMFYCSVFIFVLFY